MRSWIKYMQTDISFNVSDFYIALLLSLERKYMMWLIIVVLDIASLKICKSKDLSNIYLFMSVIDIPLVYNRSILDFLE